MYISPILSISDFESIFYFDTIITNCDSILSLYLIHSYFESIPSILIKYLRIQQAFKSTFFQFKQGFETQHVSNFESMFSVSIQ